MSNTITKQDLDAAIAQFNEMHGEHSKKVFFANSIYFEFAKAMYKNTPDVDVVRLRNMPGDTAYYLVDEDSAKQILMEEYRR